MSDVHDEIDWEWPGESGAAEGQSNFFWEGVVIRECAARWNVKDARC